MKKIFIILIIINAILVSGIIYFTKHQKQVDALQLLQESYSKPHTPSVDHTKFEILQKKFNSPQEVTAACLSCHTERGKEVMNTRHWKWQNEEYIEGRGLTNLGKKNILNNFCIGIGGNEQSCNRCHAGFGWADSTFDFHNQHNIDCMVCHDNTGEYFKQSGGAGNPDPSVNLNKVATQVGKPLKANCGYCHFYGGGGNNVKHGDLEDAQLNCSRDVDVHMAKTGINMECVDCHTTEKHVISGKMYSVSSTNTNRLSCTQCHGNTPHELSIINEHTVKVACQTCHIPTYAKANATKMTWDWSTACKLKNGEPYHEEDSLGNHTYLSEKGTFTWGKDVKPEYVWFNGTADHYMFGDKVDTTKPIAMNTLRGSYNDPAAQIVPVKVHRANQLFDPVNGRMIQPKLFDKEKGKGALWKDFDFDAASAAGMKYIGQPYSGTYTFVQTESFWPLNHQVAPKEQSLSCKECHSTNGRLANLNDFYLPGRDQHAGVELFGMLSIILSFIGIAIHASLRIRAHKRQQTESKTIEQ